MNKVFHFKLGLLKDNPLLRIKTDMEYYTDRKTIISWTPGT